MFSLFTYLGHAITYTVSDAEQLQEAMLNVQPGDEIEILPGDYQPEHIYYPPQSAAFWSDVDGTISQPIFCVG